jgi:hypothetical protein
MKFFIILTLSENFYFTICCKDSFYVSLDFDRKNGLFIVNIEYYIEIELLMDLLSK